MYDEGLAVMPHDSLGGAATLATSSTHQNFWDETVDRLSSNFEKFWQRDDSANALACFDRLAEHRYAALKTLPDFDPSRKSIVSVFQPKSGGTFLHNRMLQLGYKEFWWLFPYRVCHATCFAGDAALKLYLSGGCTCHTHARPFPNLLAAFDRAGLDKIWVHLRNPAESVLSAYHHYLGEGHGEGSIGEERRKQATAEAKANGIDTQLDKSQFAVAHVDWFIDWAGLWLEHAKARPNKIVLSFHRELVNPQLLFVRVFRKFGIELRDKISANPLPQDRFRQKESNDWRCGLSSSAQRLVEERVWSRLADLPAFEHLWT